MRHWGYWEWLAYTCLLVAAMILAADTSLRIAPDLAHKLPHFLESPYWGFAPLGLLGVATVILVFRHFDWLAGMFGSAYPIKLFLERDAASDLLGIQTFTTISYIQISVTTTALLTECRAWSTRVEYSPDGSPPFAVEHNERHRLPWSKHETEQHIKLTPGEPPARISVAVFNNEGIGFDPNVGTPENLIHKFQRPGVHKIHVTLNAMNGDKAISRLTKINIHWRSPNGSTVVWLDKN